MTADIPRRHQDPAGETKHLTTDGKLKPQKREPGDPNDTWEWVQKNMTINSPTPAQPSERPPQDWWNNKD